MVSKFKINFNSFHNLIELWNDYYENIVKSKKYYVPVVLFSLISYSFALFNRTVGIDDLAYLMYGRINHKQVAGYRWGSLLSNAIFETFDYNPSIGRLVGTIAIVISGILLGFLFYCLSNKRSKVWIYTIISSIYISYPLINELWDYGYYDVYTPIVLLVLVLQFIYDDIDYKKMLLFGVILSPVMSLSEALMFAYVTLVLFILLSKYCLYKNEKEINRNWFLEGLRYACPLIVAFLLKFVIGYVLIKIMHLNYSPNGDTTILYLSKGLEEGLKGIIYNGWYYVVRGLVYFPIGEFVISIFLLFFVCIKTNNNKMSILFYLFILISLFFQSYIQGAYMPYRTAKTVHFFVAFVFGLFTDYIYSTNREYTSEILITVLLFLSLRQSIYLNDLLVLNNQRSDNEMSIARSIGYKLYSEYDLSKKVVFCGEYQLGDFIESKIAIDDNSFAGMIEKSIRNITGHNETLYHNEFVSTNVNSVLNWSEYAFDGQIMIKRYMSYLGFDIKTEESIHEKADLLKYEKVAKENSMHPLEIKEFDDYILVYLGERYD